MMPVVTGHHANHIGTSMPGLSGRSLVLCADGGSEDGATSLYSVDQRGVERIAVLDRTFVTGRVYGTATQMTVQPDFITAHASDTGKMMGLAAFGEPDAEFASLLEHHFDDVNRVHPEGVDELRERFGLSATYSRWPDERRRDLAATVQRRWEEELLALAARYRDDAPSLSIVGGCAMNVVANGRLANAGTFRRIFVPAMPTDAGQALGGLWARYPALVTNSPYLGRDVGADADPAIVAGELADDLVAGRVVAVCTGRSESGPRALGNRSLLALPSSDEVRVRVSEEIKGREAYRPIGPVVRAEDLGLFFAGTVSSPYMSYAYPALSRTRTVAPAIVHADGTSRVQTVTREQHPLLYAVLGALEARGAAPIVANTSMNVAGEPMVDTLDDAMRFFETTAVDVMYVGNRRFAHG